MPPSPRRPWTDTDDQRLRELADAGTSVRAIAAELDRSKSAVERRLRALRTGVNRTGTVAATKARQIDAKARRAALSVALLEDAERLRAQLWQPVTVFNFGGKDNTYNEHQLPQPTHADQLKLAQAVATTVGAIERLERLNADHGVEQAVGMLDQIGKAISAAAEALGNPDPDDPNG